MGFKRLESTRLCPGSSTFLKETYRIHLVLNVFLQSKNLLVDTLQLVRVASLVQHRR